MSVATFYVVCSERAKRAPAGSKSLGGLRHELNTEQYHGWGRDGLEQTAVCIWGR